MSPNIDELRKKVTAPMRRRGVVRAGIFGSVARGEAGEGSDVDFLVELEKGRSLVDLAGLRLDLCDLLDRDVAYIADAAIGSRMYADALHIALATVARVDVLVSWNFKHIVNLKRIHLYNAVNLKNGYPLLEIRTPREVPGDE